MIAKRRNLRSNWLLCAVFMFFVTPLLLIPLRANATPITIDPSDGIDVILVIDTSGSMQTADPERITLEASSLFMDMMETRNSRIGIIGFSGDLHTVMPLTPISDLSVRDDIRRTISGFAYHGWTDIGLALRTAVEMLLDSPLETNSPMILLFTDGRINLPPYWPNNRTVEVSYQDAWWAVEAVEGIVPIYTIGLNHDGTLNIDFLQEIAVRTSATYYIAEEADALPRIFNEIFANHIRSSIMEIAMIIADGDTYTDVTVPIPSAFVSEANIIMLSTRPIVNVQLFDPTGRQVLFDGESYSLTYANRYSMIKVLEPMVGDWLLSVRGLPEDRITINLIYNYNVDVSFAISQPGRVGPYLDPTRPIDVQARFFSALPQAQILAIFDDAVATLHVHDLDMSLIAVYDMYNMGNAFYFELVVDPPQDVRINVHVTHPGFEQTTAFMNLNFDQDMIAHMLEVPPEPEPTPTPAPTPTPTPTPVQTPVPTPVPTPEPEPEPDEPRNIVLFIVIGALLALLVLLAVIRALVLSQKKKRVFTGHIELRAMLADGNYTSLEAPDLSTFVGQISLLDFLNASLGSKSDKIVQTGIPIWDIYMRPGTHNNQPVILLSNKGTKCQITDGDGNAQLKKKIIWEDGRQLIFRGHGESTRLDATYRAYED